MVTFVPGMQMIPLFVAYGYQLPAPILSLAPKMARTPGVST
jgi:hypothetical protein